MLGVEGNQDVAQSSHGKVQVKGGQPKQKSGKRHGYVCIETFSFLVNFFLSFVIIFY